MADPTPLRIVDKQTRRDKIAKMLSDLQTDIADGCPIEDIYIIIVQKTGTDPSLCTLIGWDTGLTLAQAVYMLEAHKYDLLQASKRVP